MKGVRIFYLIVASWNQAMQVELIYDEQFPSCLKSFDESYIHRITFQGILF